MTQRNLAFALIALASIARMIPHSWNFTPLAAIGLFSASYFGYRNWGILAPFISLFLTDLLLNNTIYSQYYEGFTWITSWWIYAAYAAVIGLGIVFLHGKSVTAGRIVGVSLLASVSFFLLSNLNTFFETKLYPQTFAGFLTCLTAGLPFFKNTLLGDLLYSGVIFGAFEWAKQRFTVPQPLKHG